jgi:hypothetical protein
LGFFWLFFFVFGFTNRCCFFLRFGFFFLVGKTPATIGNILGWDNRATLILG